jgi:hypothetical protein
LCALGLGPLGDLEDLETAHAAELLSNSPVSDPLNALHVPNTRPNVALAYNYVQDAIDGRYVGCSTSCTTSTSTSSSTSS